MLHTIAGMTSTHNYAQLFSVEMGSHDIFLLRLACNCDPPNSDFQIARITGLSHHIRLPLAFEIEVAEEP
jgi:hypothetical protein